eukprot:2911342-Pyramimonas_sp.AAC.1
MYYAPRRIRWGASYSYAVQVQRGVLPGCSVEMFLLQLVTMLPLDIFEQSFANDSVHHTLDMRMTSPCKWSPPRRIWRTT